MRLHERKCTPCSGGIPPIKGIELQKYMMQVEGWDLNRENTHIMKTYTFTDFKEAIDFVNEVGRIAEREGHHPDLSVHYREVTVTLWTHKIGGLSENDFILAARIDTVQGFPQTFSNTV